MKTPTHFGMNAETVAPNLIRALEILTGCAGDIPMEGETRRASMQHQHPWQPVDCEPAADIPLAPGTVVPLILQFTANADLDQEISFHLYRRSVVSEWGDGPSKDTALAGIDHRFETLRPLFQSSL